MAALVLSLTFSALCSMHLLHTRTIQIVLTQTALDRDSFWYNFIPKEIIVLLSGFQLLKDHTSAASYIKYPSTDFNKFENYFRY